MPSEPVTSVKGSFSDMIHGQDHSVIEEAYQQVVRGMTKDLLVKLAADGTRDGQQTLLDGFKAEVVKLRAARDLTQAAVK